MRAPPQLRSPDAQVGIQLVFCPCTPLRTCLPGAAQAMRTGSHHSAHSAGTAPTCSVLCCEAHKHILYGCLPNNWHRVSCRQTRQSSSSSSSSAGSAPAERLTAGSAASTCSPAANCEPSARDTLPRRFDAATLPESDASSTASDTSSAEPSTARPHYESFDPQTRTPEAGDSYSPYSYSSLRDDGAPLPARAHPNRQLSSQRTRTAAVSSLVSRGVQRVSSTMPALPDNLPGVGSSQLRAQTLWDQAQHLASSSSGSDGASTPTTPTTVHPATPLTGYYTPATMQQTTVQRAANTHSTNAHSVPAHTDIGNVPNLDSNASPALRRGVHVHSAPEPAAAISLAASEGSASTGSASEGSGSCAGERSTHSHSAGVPAAALVPVGSLPEASPSRSFLAPQRLSIYQAVAQGCLAQSDSSSESEGPQQQQQQQQQHTVTSFPSNARRAAAIRAAIPGVSSESCAPMLHNSLQRSAARPLNNAAGPLAVELDAVPLVSGRHTSQVDGRGAQTRQPTPLRSQRALTPLSSSSSSSFSENLQQDQSSTTAPLHTEASGTRQPPPFSSQSTQSTPRGGSFRDQRQQQQFPTIAAHTVASSNPAQQAQQRSRSPRCKQPSLVWSHPESPRHLPFLERARALLADTPWSDSDSDSLDNSMDKSLDNEVERGTQQGGRASFAPASEVYGADISSGAAPNQASPGVKKAAGCEAAHAPRAGASMRAAHAVDALSDTSDSSGEQPLAVPLTGDAAREAAGVTRLAVRSTWQQRLVFNCDETVASADSSAQPCMACRILLAKSCSTYSS